jgi:hypothetical protein
VGEDKKKQRCVHLTLPFPTFPVLSPIFPHPFSLIHFPTNFFQQLELRKQEAKVCAPYPPIYPLHFLSLSILSFPSHESFGVFCWWMRREIQEECIPSLSLLFPLSPSPSPYSLSLSPFHFFFLVMDKREKGNLAWEEGEIKANTFPL